MPKYKVKVTTFAEDALREIAKYILDEFKSPQASIHTLQSIRKGISTLDEMPSRVHLTPEEPWKSNGIRRLRVENYYVYFWIDEAKLLVQITNVVYVGRDQKKQLRIMPME